MQGVGCILHNLSLPLFYSGSISISSSCSTSSQTLKKAWTLIRNVPIPWLGADHLKLSLNLHRIGFKVVVYQGTIREKPSTEEEARQFIRGCFINFYQKFLSCILANSSSHCFTDYSGGSGQVVGSVVVTNLVTGSRKGGWESAEVLHRYYYIYSYITSFSSTSSFSAWSFFVNKWEAASNFSS